MSRKSIVAIAVNKGCFIIPTLFDNKFLFLFEVNAIFIKVSPDDDELLQSLFADYDFVFQSIVLIMCMISFFMNSIAG